MGEHAYVQDFAEQWGDVWMLIPILLAVLLLLVLGGLKLVKLFLIALKG